jgi:hypothetical protein
MIIIVILLVIIIVWLQYPTINNPKCNDKDTPLNKKIFNLVKVPLVVICFILLLWSSYSCVKKSSIDAYISIPKY